MAKLKRSVLKNLIKECLVEILLEGLHEDDAADALQEAVSKNSTRPKSARVSSNGDMLKKIQNRKKMLNEKIVSRSAPPPKAADDFMGGITNDPVMAQIFADTANTTLPAMMAGDRNSASGKQGYTPSDGAARMVHDNELEDLFEGATNWATLAFSSDEKAN